MTGGPFDHRPDEHGICTVCGATVQPDVPGGCPANVDPHTLAWGPRLSTPEQAREGVRYLAELAKKEKEDQS